MMTRSTIVGGATAIAILFLVLVSAYWFLEPGNDPFTEALPEGIPLTALSTSDACQDCLYGRITTNDGSKFEGRLRFGGNEEAFWGDYFDGFKDENPWTVHVPPEQLKERRLFEIFGIKVTEWESQIDLSRPFMARFGDIARIEAEGRDLWVTLKSGTVFHLDRFAADDFADGLRVWDRKRGVIDLNEWQIGSIDFLPSPGHGTFSGRLYGTVHTQYGDFSGFIHWNREDSLSSDEIAGNTVGGELRLRFDTIRSITRNSQDSSLVTLFDGGEVLLSGTQEVGQDNRGIFIDDGRYGRVLVSWDVFEHVDFSPGGSGPAYEEFSPGRPLIGSVLTLDRHSLAGRLVFDLDESETTETLDASTRGVNYNIPFSLVESIVLTSRDDSYTGRIRVTLRNGEELLLERAGDLGDGNAGMLIFLEGNERSKYVPWSEIRQIEFRNE
jgi:hypothetical protein